MQSARRDPWRWVTALAVVRFDDTQGQVLDYQFPPEELTASERQDVKMLALPECFQSSPASSSAFCFRVRSSKHLPLHALQVHEQQFEHCFVLFQRLPDASKARGYNQFSIVLVSPWPFYDFFTAVLQQLRDMHLTSGVEHFPLFFEHTLQWPRPSPGLSGQLPVLGNLLDVQIPTYADRLYPRMALAGDAGLKRVSYLERVGIFEETNLFSSLVQHGFLDHLWTLWQLVLTGERVLVIAPTADLCSLLVRGLVSLVSPMAYAGDVRPYFTTFDSDLDAVMDDASRAAIVGVANPVFARTVSSCPNALIIPADCPPGVCAVEKIYQADRSLDDAMTFSIRKQAPVLVLRQPPIVGPDASVIQQLSTMGAVANDGLHEQERARIHFVCGMLLREHFRKLTVAVMRPFDKFFHVRTAHNDPRSSAPSSSSTSTRKGRTLSMVKGAFSDKSHHRSASQPTVACLSRGAQWMGIYADPEALLEPLDPVHFPTELRRDPPKLPRVLQTCKYWRLYAAFLKSSNFKLWFSEERAVKIAELQEIIRETCRLTEPQDLILATVFQSGSGHVTENELLGLCLRIRAALAVEQGRPEGDRDYDLERRMEEHLAAVEAAVSPVLADAIREASIKPKLDMSKGSISDSSRCPPLLSNPQDDDAAWVDV